MTEKVTIEEWREVHGRIGGTNALKIAKELQLMAKRRIYPNNPYLTTDDWKDRKANDLTKCIVRFLSLIGYQAERISSMGRVIDNRKTYTDVIGRKKTIGTTQYIPGTSKNGTADISATIEGRSVKIEVKIGKDRQSDAQKIYQQEVEASGGIYYIAKDFQSFYYWLITLISELKSGRRYGS